MGLINAVRNTCFLWKHTGQLGRYMALAAGVCALDQAVKHTIETEPADNFPRELPHTAGLVELRRVHNDGFAMGRLAEHPELVRMLPLTITSGLVGVLMALCAAVKGQRLRKLGLALVIGGGASNLLDRLRKGYVVDYLLVRAGALKKAVLNIGDIAIGVGGALYLAASVLRKD